MGADRDLAHDLAALSAGMLPGIALAAATLGHGLQLVVGIERDGGRTMWRVLISGNQGLASDVLIGDTAFHALRTAIDSAITAAAARQWRVTKNPTVLVDSGECAVGIGTAGGGVWAVITVRGELLRLPVAGLGRLRDA